MHHGEKLVHFLQSEQLHPGVISWYQIVQEYAGYIDYMGMDQYLLIPFLGEWTSIYQLFWCSPGVQGFDTLPYRLSCFLVTSQCFRRSHTVADKFAIVQVLVGLNLHFLPQTINSKVWISGHSEGQFRNLGKWQVTPLETEFDLGYSQKDQQEALSKMTLGTNQQAKASRNLNFSSEQLSQRMRWTQWSLSPFPILRQPHSGY